MPLQFTTNDDGSSALVQGPAGPLLDPDDETLCVYPTCLVFNFNLGLGFAWQELTDPGHITGATHTTVFDNLTGSIVTIGDNSSNFGNSCVQWVSDIKTVNIDSYAGNDTRYQCPIIADVRFVVEIDVQYTPEVDSETGACLGTYTIHAQVHTAMVLCVIDEPNLQCRLDAFVGYHGLPLFWEVSNGGGISPEVILTGVLPTDNPTITFPEVTPTDFSLLPAVNYTFGTISITPIFDDFCGICATPDCNSPNCTGVNDCCVVLSANRLHYLEVGPATTATVDFSVVEDGIVTGTFRGTATVELDCYLFQGFGTGTGNQVDRVFEVGWLINNDGTFTYGFFGLDLTGGTVGGWSGTVGDDPTYYYTVTITVTPDPDKCTVSSGIGSGSGGSGGGSGSGSGSGCSTVCPGCYAYNTGESDAITPGVDDFWTLDGGTAYLWKAGQPGSDWLAPTRLCLTDREPADI